MHPEIPTNRILEKKISIGFLIFLQVYYVFLNFTCIVLYPECCL